MFCFANEVPGGNDVRAMAAAAVMAGIGEAADRVEHYMLVSDQKNTSWEVRITLEGGGEPIRVMVNDDQQNPEDIQRVVREAMDRAWGARRTTIRAVRWCGGWTTA